MTKIKIIKAKKSDNTSLNKKKKKVCAYARVSTDSKEQKNSYNSQIVHYTKYIKENPEWEFVGIYADEGISGTQAKKRTEFLRMIDDALAGEIDMIIAKSISRFARNTLDTLKYVRLLRQHSVDVYFEKENIHTLNLDSEMFLTLYSAFAQAESESTSQNVKMGLKAKMKKGGYCGQANPFGYNWNKKTKKLEINNDEAPTVRLVFELYEKGLGCKKIADRLNELGLKPRVVLKWDSKKVCRIIKNEKYVGDLLGQKYYVDDPMTHKKKTNFGEKEQYYASNVHEPIITRDLWNKCQEIYRKRSNKYAPDGKGHNTKYSLKYPLSSMVECGCCNASYMRRLGGKSGKEGKRVAYWRCGSMINNKHECLAKDSIREIYLEDMFKCLFNKISTHKYNNTHLLKIIKEVLNSDENKDTLKKLKEEKKIAEERLSHLIDLKLDNFDNINVYKNKEQELNKKLKEINDKIKKLSKNNKKGNKIEKQLLEIDKILKQDINIDEFDEELFKLLIKKIIIGDYEDTGIFNPNTIKFILNIDEKNVIFQRKNAMSNYDGNIASWTPILR